MKKNNSTIFQKKTGLESLKKLPLNYKFTQTFQKTKDEEDQLNQKTPPKYIKVGFYETENAASYKHYKPISKSADFSTINEK